MKRSRRIYIFLGIEFTLACLAALFCYCYWGYVFTPPDIPNVAKEAVAVRGIGLDPKWLPYNPSGTRVLKYWDEHQILSKPPPELAKDLIEMFKKQF